MRGAAAALLLATGAHAQDVDAFVAHARALPVALVASLPVRDGDRIEPLDTLARSTVFALTGGSAPLGLDPLAFYLGLATWDGSAGLQFIRVNDPELRASLGLPVDGRYASIQQLDHAGLASSDLEPLDAAKALALARQVVEGSHLLAAVQGSPGTFTAARRFLSAARTQPWASQAAAEAWVQSLAAEPASPPSWRLSGEVRLSACRPLFWAGCAGLGLGLLLLARSLRRLPPGAKAALAAVPAALSAAGTLWRGVLGGFAPLSNGAGVLGWTALLLAGWGLASAWRGRDDAWTGALCLGAGAIDVLAESLPAVFPVALLPAAALRHNDWLALHVGSAATACALFTGALLTGQTALAIGALRPARQPALDEWVTRVRATTRIGLVLLAGGAMVGAAWADASWGRAWGWEPKEVWTLLAIGAFALWERLAARRLAPFWALLAQPVPFAVLLAAWFGAERMPGALHRYGGAEGGGILLAVFGTCQLALMAVALLGRPRPVAEPAR